ncbi:hypothetical protein KTO58_12925 [Chitinophaga pendula]|uniref:MvdC/MvdD family ATP grasp protein n=1 Tax=Chitinophaga TaxID=79328 RepID=UPI000BAED113|nr:MULTISPECIES: MvdD family ATP-grasp ribosomal peptide maturase [Chitinophaga]ASZ12348.1 MvdD family ATP-grasp ribosomal peptide maturase [Chitinophaga sp. MD30]UCJ10058.1 hypothetical protein KTO58_12925 [Chitinophaga pendula]
MATQKVLIITHTGDNISINTVSDQIAALGGEAIRFNVDTYPLSVRLSTTFVNNQHLVHLHTADGQYRLDDVSAVWFRRGYNIGKGLDTVLDKEFLSAAKGEVQRTLFGMLEGLDAFHLERSSVYRRLDSKEEQLRLAVKAGLQIPPTCISNDAQVVADFINTLQTPVIAKMQSSFAIYREGVEHVVFTNEITSQNLQQLDSIQYCPMVFQQKIAKQLELRITIVGNKIFAFSIDSSKLENSKVDWRKEGVALINDWQPYTLPDTLQQQLLTFMQYTGLNYGAIDVILSPEGEYFFLEVNAAGEYFWLDMLCDNAISAQIAAVLLGKTARR